MISRFANTLQGYQPENTRHRGQERYVSYCSQARRAIYDSYCIHDPSSASSAPALHGIGIGSQYNRTNHTSLASSQDSSSESFPFILAQALDNAERKQQALTSPNRADPQQEDIKGSLHGPPSSGNIGANIATHAHSSLNTLVDPDTTLFPPYHVDHSSYPNIHLNWAQAPTAPRHIHQACIKYTCSTH